MCFQSTHQWSCYSCNKLTVYSLFFITSQSIVECTFMALCRNNEIVMHACWIDVMGIVIVSRWLSGDDAWWCQLWSTSRNIDHIGLDQYSGGDLSLNITVCTWIDMGAIDTQDGQTKDSFLSFYKGLVTNKVFQIVILEHVPQTRMEGMKKPLLSILTIC